MRIISVNIYSTWSLDYVMLTEVPTSQVID